MRQPQPRPAPPLQTRAPNPRRAPPVAGADDFTPLLILAVIRARPPRLGSNIAYIERYRYAQKLTGEAAYYFVQLVGGELFGGRVPRALPGAAPGRPLWAPPVGTWCVG